MDLMRRIFIFVSAFFILTGPVYAAGRAMVEKNLFSQDRKPTHDDAPAPTGPAGPPIPPKTIQLDGIMFRGSVKKALVRIKGGPGAGPRIPNPKDAEKDKAKLKKPQETSPFVTVTEGEMVQDYKVTKISPRSISLEKGGQVFEVFLFAEGKVLPPMPAAPPPVPGQAGQPGQPGQPPVPQTIPSQGMGQGDVPPGQFNVGSPQNPAAIQAQRGARRPPPPDEDSQEAEVMVDEEPEEGGQ